MDFARLVLASDTTGLRDAQRELRNLTSAGDQTERNVTRATGMMDKGFRNVAMAAARMAGALTGAFLSGRWLVGAIRDSEELERTMMRTQAIIRATGGVAGRSADQLRQQADALARATLADERQILRVQQQLLTFRNIRGEVFDDAIEAALDLSEAMGVDLSSASLQVARALEDPVRGVTALTRSGTVFTEAQRDMIRSMVEAGNVAGAQALILDELKAQYGGAAEAAAQGLGGAVDGLGQSMRDMGRSMVENFGLMDATQAAVEALDRGARFLGDNMEYVRIGALGAGAVVLGMYTPAIVTATGATLAWVASLITLRGALLATGIGALIVGAGMLIDFLIRLRSATGSWGEALSALGALAEGVWEGIKTSASSIGPALESVWVTIQAGFMSMVESIQRIWADFLHNVVGGMREIPGMEATTLAIHGAAVRAGSAVNETGASVDELRGRADALKEEAKSLATSGFDRARDALADLRAIMADSTDETTEAADAARILSQELENIGGASGGGGSARAAAEGIDEAKRATEEAARAQEQWANNMAGHFDGLITGGKNLSGVLQSMARQLESRGWQQLFMGLGSGFGGMFGGVGAPLNAMGSGPLASYEGGGFTGSGPRTGGLDGRGGQLAMIHPNETVIDHTRGGGDPVQVVVRVMPSGEFDARVENTARAVVRVETPRMIGGSFRRMKERGDIN